MMNHFYKESYNPFNMAENDFLNEYVQFIDEVSQIDKKLACIFRNAFNNIHNLDSFLKVSVESFPEAQKKGLRVSKVSWEDRDGICFNEFEE